MRCLTTTDVVNSLKKHGYKITPQRLAIINFLIMSPKPLTAKEVLYGIRSSFPETSSDTVYRNLNLLADLGLSLKINLMSNDTSRYEITNRHHHHLVCLGCSEAQCLDICILSEQDLLKTVKEGFTVSSHIFEIYGYCPACQVEK